MYYDFHTHSSFSADSEAEARDMIEAAIKKGVTKYCFTDHQDFDFPYEDLKFDVNPDEYFKKLRPLQEEYKSQIDIRIGIEVGMEDHLWDRLEDYVNSAPFDYVIGSMHLLNRMDPYYPEFFEGRDEAELFEEFFLSTLKNIKGFKNFNCLGHLDYIVRYAPTKNKKYSYEAYRDTIDKILVELIESGRGLEVNSSGFRRGLGHPHPCDDVLKRYRQLGGEIITTGSDAHTPEDIAADFDSALALIKESGFKYITIFKDRKLEQISISRLK